MQRGPKSGQDELADLDGLSQRRDIEPTITIVVECIVA